MEKLNIAFVQMDINWESKKTNYSKIENNFFSSIQNNKIDLIILPEMFATGFTMQPEKFYEEHDGETIIWLKHWAKKLNTSIAAGIITNNESDEFLNTLIVCHPDKDPDYYYKRHLFRMGEENKHYKGGVAQNIIEIKNWKINLQICYDLRFPVFSRNAYKNGVADYDAMIYIANWPQVRSNAWDCLLQARAIENQSYVVGVNRVGIDNNNISHSGNSTCIDPRGNYITEPITNIEKLTFCELNFELLSNSRKKFPVLLDVDNFNLADK